MAVVRFQICLGVTHTHTHTHEHVSKEQQSGCLTLELLASFGNKQQNLRATRHLSEIVGKLQCSEL